MKRKLHPAKSARRTLTWAATGAFIVASANMSWSAQIEQGKQAELDAQFEQAANDANALLDAQYAAENAAAAAEQAKQDALAAAAQPAGAKKSTASKAAPVKKKVATKKSAKSSHTKSSGSKK